MQTLILESIDYSNKALEIYRSISNVSFLNDNETLAEKLQNIEVLVVRLKYKISSALIDLAPNLKFIISPTTGEDHIDYEYAREKGIKLITLKGAFEFLASIPSTAEHTWALLLALVRNLPAAANDVAAGRWNRQIFRGNNLRGKKIGIIGLGRVGKQVAAFATAFGMETIAYDPHISQQFQNVKMVPTVTDLLQSSDIITVHIPLAGNENYLSQQVLAHVKHGAFLVNTSRGGVWDEKAIADMVVSGQLEGVATDVLCGEQDNNWQKSPLVELLSTGRKILITPHIAGATIESMHATEEYVAVQFHNYYINNK
jgi:D-3-phosphoglycerate dehydrogenase / 2-oxoglutarate reductase